MLKVKIRLKERKFIIPVPYAILRMITSKRLVRYANKAIEKEGKTTLRIPEIERKDIKPLLRVLAENRGLVLVETKLKDGTEVNIRL